MISLMMSTVLFTEAPTVIPAATSTVAFTNATAALTSRRFFIWKKNKVEQNQDELLNNWNGAWNVILASNSTVAFTTAAAVASTSTQRFLM